MKITIVIPVYNVAEYIIKCLQSVANQSFNGEIECLIIDDKGQDNSMFLVKEYLKEYWGKVHFRIIEHERNFGLSTARNTGITNAAGEYIYFLDSDDWLTENCLEMLSAPLRKTEFDFVIGDIKLEGAIRYIATISGISGEIKGNNKIMQLYLKNQWYMMAQNKLCNSNFIKNNKIFFAEGFLHEDDIWSLALANKADSMYVVNEPTYHYLLREGSISSMKVTDDRHLRGYERTYDDMTLIAPLYPSLSKDFKKRIHFYAMNLFIYGHFDRKVFNRLYNKVRAKTPYSPFLNLLKKEISLKTFIINMHFALPKKIGRFIAWNYYRMKG